MHRTAKITLSLTALCLVTMFFALFINIVAGHFVSQHWLGLVRDVASFTGIVSFLGIVGLITFMFVYPARVRGASTAEEREMMCLLSNQALELTKRMEALETILLARSDHCRETAGRS